MTWSVKIEVPRFNGTGNFSLWQTRVKDMLNKNGMKKVLLEKKPDSITHGYWEELQEKVGSTIRTCLGDEVVHQVINLVNSKEIWDKLEKIYMSKSPSSKLYVKQRLYLFKMSEGSNLIQHVNQFNQITTDLGRVGVTVEDEDKAMMLLCSLTPEYETLVTALLSNKETITMQSATDSLLGHHNRHQQHIW
ncbi:Retrovirus-related Pol polyprotein from transposon TNT 1-94 [Cardamine amara subsp. amara]|uniref:Retrovirus-related Pol polyprotein from transposon TNT 1-94 n=1 Tax=Cardamine amara subsp. amara TaxID=228776 RepID=A0ABD0YZ13_CARAN